VVEVMAVSKGTMIGVALAAAAVVLAGVPVGRLLPVLLVLACPLMMVFMHRGGHGRHASHSAQPAESRDERLATRQ
jgi:anti-sigma factor RsiW